MDGSDLYKGPCVGCWEDLSLPCPGRGICYYAEASLSESVRSRDGREGVFFRDVSALLVHFLLVGMYLSRCYPEWAVGKLREVGDGDVDVPSEAHKAVYKAIVFGSPVAVEQNLEKWMEGK